MMNIPLSNPDITDLEREYVLSVLNTPNLSLGPLLPRFELATSTYLGSKHAVAVNSGTSGLHLAMKALEIKDDDVVITTPFSFIASANCILFERAIPQFVDIEPATYNIDTDKMKDVIERLIRQGRKIKAILPVHVFGHPCNMEEIINCSEKYGLEIIEDACEAIGSEYKGRKAGTIGKIGIYAFYPNKQITTGEGGLIVTDDENIAAVCKSLRNQGRADNGGWLNHERLGYNYRLSDLNCALGLAQMVRIEEILKKRSAVAEMYSEKLKNVEEVYTPHQGNNVKVSWFVYVIRLSDRFSRNKRDNILKGLRESGIGCNNYFTPIHLQPFYRKLFGFKEGDFPVTEQVAERTIALPFFNNLREDQVDYVVESLKRLLRKS